MAKKICVYCGRVVSNGERDHVIPSCLYPETKASSKVQRLTVPCCRLCNNGWSDDEPHFRNLLMISGEPNQSVSDLWGSTVKRSFKEKDGRRRVSDLWEQMAPVQTTSGDRHVVYPASDARFRRILCKIVRGLHYHHKLWYPVPEDMVEVDFLRYIVPPDIEEGMSDHHREPDIFRYRFGSFDAFEDIPMSSAWLFTFYDNRKFIGWVQKQQK